MMTNAEAYTKELMNEVAKEVFKEKTLAEIIKEEQSIKLTATHQPHYQRILSGQEKRRERRKKQKPKKNN
jgi:hypothetical protein